MSRLKVVPMPHTVFMSESMVGTDFGDEPARLLKAGYRVESSLPGILVLVAPKIKVPVGPMLFLSVISLGFWLPVWGILVGLPRVCRQTFTIVEGEVMKKRTWRNA